MHKKFLAALAVVLIAQIAVPVSMIVGRENVILNGTAFRFATQPIDPTDYLRGKYVQLYMPQEPLPVTDTLNLEDGLYGYLSVTREGLARIDSLTATRPESGEYINVDFSYRRGNLVHYTLPFDRFYMEESKAPVAEALYLRLPDSVKAYARVKVLKGEAVIEDVIVGGRPIGELAREHIGKN